MALPHMRKDVKFPSTLIYLDKVRVLGCTPKPERQPQRGLSLLTEVAAAMKTVSQDLEDFPVLKFAFLLDSGTEQLYDNLHSSLAG